ncbi:hypothetical protein IWX63_001930 [Arthrobacter sp. CAN_A2]|uniref:cyclophilin-like fold protein n=1 Tax=Arthrobacter sp. CAN_A2 TaxID=2787718 RepID=UPI0018F00D67
MNTTSVLPTPAQADTPQRLPLLALIVLAVIGFVLVAMETMPAGALRLRTVSGAAALMVTAALTGCTDDSGATSDATSDSAASPTTQDTLMAPSPDSTPGRTTGDPDSSSAASAGSTPIVLELDGTTVTGRLSDGAASVSLMEQLPLTVSLSDFGGQEKVAELPEPLDLDGAPAGSGAEPGMIGYYVPDQRLILYYDQVGYYAGIVPLGTFDDVPAVESPADASTVTLRPGG